MGKLVKGDGDTEPVFAGEDDVHTASAEEDDDDIDCRDELMEQHSDVNSALRLDPASYASLVSGVPGQVRSVLCLPAPLLQLEQLDAANVKLLPNIDVDLTSSPGHRSILPTPPARPARAAPRQQERPAAFYTMLG